MQAQVEASKTLFIAVDPDQPFAHLSKLTHPILVLNGKRDVMINSLNSVAYGAKYAECSALIYLDTGNAVQFRYQERFLKHAIQFRSE